MVSINFFLHKGKITKFQQQLEFQLQYWITLPEVEEH